MSTQHSRSLFRVHRIDIFGDVLVGQDSEVCGAKSWGIHFEDGAGESGLMESPPEMNAGFEHDDIELLQGNIQGLEYTGSRDLREMWGQDHAIIRPEVDNSYSFTPVSIEVFDRTFDPYGIPRKFI
jgi:hypothetical protein